MPMIREAIAAVAAGRDLTEAEACRRHGRDHGGQGHAVADRRLPHRPAHEGRDRRRDHGHGARRCARTPCIVEIEGDLLDVVSTGGGAFDPLNISTAAALVCAGAGVRVAKHGNRGFTSASGAADVLEALGAKIDLPPRAGEGAASRRAGFGFLFAQGFHPAMRFAGPTRREIGLRTIFNALGPLTNPAGAQYQLLGAGDAALAPRIAERGRPARDEADAGGAQRGRPRRGFAGRADPRVRSQRAARCATYVDQRPRTPASSAYRSQP